MPLVIKNKKSWGLSTILYGLFALVLVVGGASVFALGWMDKSTDDRSQASGYNCAQHTTLTTCRGASQFCRWEGPELSTGNGMCVPNGNPIQTSSPTPRPSPVSTPRPSPTPIQGSYNCAQHTTLTTCRGASQFCRWENPVNQGTGKCVPNGNPVTTPPPTPPGNNCSGYGSMAQCGAVPMCNWSVAANTCMPGGPTPKPAGWVPSQAKPGESRTSGILFLAYKGNNQFSWRMFEVMNEQLFARDTSPMSWNQVVTLPIKNDLSPSGLGDLKFDQSVATLTKAQLFSGSTDVVPLNQRFTSFDMVYLYYPANFNTSNPNLKAHAYQFAVVGGKIFARCANQIPTQVNPTGWTKWWLAANEGTMNIPGNGPITGFSYEPHDGTDKLVMYAVRDGKLHRRVRTVTNWGTSCNNYQVSDSPWQPSASNFLPGLGTIEFYKRLVSPNSSSVVKVDLVDTHLFNWRRVSSGGGWMGYY